VNVPAVVSQVFWTRWLIVTVSACSPNEPGVPVVPGTSFSVPASWPMAMLWKLASPLSELASTIRLLADTGLPDERPARSSRVTEPILTAWHRLVSFADRIADSATGICLSPDLTVDPNCSNPEPVSWLAVTVNS
jgi:hypothetical protein